MARTPEDLPFISVKDRMFMIERSLMVELLYFSSLDLMLKVEYVKRTNSWCYASHRAMEHNERAMAEEYMMGKMTPKADDSPTPPAMVVYLGTDKRLPKRLARFHQENDLKTLFAKEKEITAAVNNLILISMRHYYTEKIGELIISARRELKAGRQSESKLTNLKQQMNDLLKAYNVYADRRVTLNEIIPVELKSCWPGLEEARGYMVASP